MNFKNFTIENEEELANEFITNNSDKLLLITGMDGRSDSRLYGISEKLLKTTAEGILYGLISTNMMTGALPLILKKETLMKDAFDMVDGSEIEVEQDLLDVLDGLDLDQAEELVLERLAKMEGKELIKVKVQYFEPGQKI